MREFVSGIKKIDEINKESLEKLIFDISIKKFKNTDEEKSEFIIKLFNDFYNDLQKLNLLSEKNIKTLIITLKSALCYENEKMIFDLIHSADKIKKEMLNQKKSMQTMISSAHTNLLNLAEANDLNSAKKYINEVFNEPLSHKFLKETSELVFVSMIENGFDVKDMTTEAIKNLIYLNIIDGEFSKKRILDIARIIISKAILVANESKIFANELTDGAVKGLNLGVIKAIDKFKNDIHFLPQELFNDEIIKDLDSIFDDLHKILNILAEQTNEPLKTNLQNIIDIEFGGYLGKFKKLSNELSEQISLKLEELQLEDKYKKLRKNFEEKFDEFSQNGKEFGAKLLEIAKNTLKNKKDNE